MADEPTTGEVSRQLADYRQSNRDEHDRLRRGIGHKVNQDVYDADQRFWHERWDQLRQDFVAIQKQREEDAERIEHAKADRAANRKWMIAAVLIPVGIGLLEIYFAIKGVR